VYGGYVFLMLCHFFNVDSFHVVAFERRDVVGGLFIYMLGEHIEKHEIIGS
jgi:hypothetical protein